jgi:O-antigen/teichoic acid export membrane protein
MRNFSYLNDAAWYLAGQLLSRGIGFFLIPFYTNELTPEDYGVIGTLTLLPILLTGFFSAGVQTAMFRLYHDADSENHKRSILGNALVISLVSATPLTLLGVHWASEVSTLMLGSPKYGLIVIQTLCALYSGVITAPFLSYLTLEGRIKSAVAINCVGAMITTLLSIYFILVEHWGAWGFFAAGALSQSICFGVGLVAVNTLFNFDAKKIKPMLILGIPGCFSCISYFGIHYSDRYLLQMYLGIDAVGIYCVGGNIGMAMSIMVTSLAAAWANQYSRHVANPEAFKEKCATSMTRFIAFMVLIVSGFLLFSRPLVTFMVNPAYYECWKVIGLTALSQALWGVYAMTLPGTFYAKKNHYNLFLEAGASLLNVALCCILIPIQGIAGAATATTLAFLSLAIASWVINNRLYPVNYEYDKILNAIVALGIAILVSNLTQVEVWKYTGIALIIYGAMMMYFLRLLPTYTEKRLSGLVKIKWMFTDVGCIL